MPLSNSLSLRVKDHRFFTSSRKVVDYTIYGYEVEDLDSHLTTMRLNGAVVVRTRASGDCVSQQTHCLGINGTEASP